jgi:hypothetical protein
VILVASHCGRHPRRVGNHRVEPARVSIATLNEFHSSYTPIADLTHPPQDNNHPASVCPWGSAVDVRPPSHPSRLMPSSSTTTERTSTRSSATTPIRPRRTTSTCPSERPLASSHAGARRALGSIALAVQRTALRRADVPTHDSGETTPVRRGTASWSTSRRQRSGMPRTAPIDGNPRCLSEVVRVGCRGRA